MAKFPTVERRVSATGQGSFVQKQPDTQYAQALQSVGVAVSGLGDIITAIDEKAKLIEQNRKSSDAQIQIQKTINDYSLKFAEDMNPDNWDGYYKGLEKDINGVVNGIDDPFVKQQMSQDAQARTNAALFSMKSTAVKRNMARAKNNLAVLKQASINAVNTGKESLIMDSKATFQKAVIDYATLTNQSQEWIDIQLSSADSARTEQMIDNLATTNPDAAVEMTLDSDLFSAEEKASKVDEINKLADKREQMIKDDKADNAVDVYNSALNEISEDPFKYTPTQLEEIGRSVGMKPARINNLKNAVLKNPNVIYNTSFKLSELNREKLKLFKKVTGNPTRLRLGKREAANEWLDLCVTQLNKGYITSAKFNTLTGDTLALLSDESKMTNIGRMWNFAVNMSVAQNPSNWATLANETFDKLMASSSSADKVPTEMMADITNSNIKKQDEVIKQVATFNEGTANITFTRDSEGNLISQ